MTTVNFGVVCKLIIAFQPENICVSGSWKVKCQLLQLSISLHRSIAQYHKSSSVMNSPAPHEYEPGSLKNEIHVNAIR